MSIVQWLQTLEIDCEKSEFLEQAFIHTSYVNEHKTEQYDNERLEFIGDAVLQQWISVQLFNIKPPLKEGEMTTIRAQFVCEEALAEYTLSLSLQQFLKLGVGEERNGGRLRKSILANLFEAFLGALYLECGLDAIDKLCQKIITPKLVNVRQLKITDFKTRLQEFVQSDSRKTVVYEVISMTGPSNKPEFEVVVKLDHLILGRGKGNSKKRAEQQAAKNAFDKLVY